MVNIKSDYIYNHKFMKDQRIEISVDPGVIIIDIVIITANYLLQCKNRFEFLDKLCVQLEYSRAVSILYRFLRAL